MAETEMPADWGAGEKTTLMKEQLEQLRILVDECWEERNQISTEEEKIEARKKALTDKEATVKEILDSAGLDSFAGTLCVYESKESDGINGPQSDEDWAAFKVWMKEKHPDAYEGFFKMHLGSLKAFVKKEMELAAVKAEEKKEGEECQEFSIPGIPKPSPYKYIKPRLKNKKGK